MSRLLATALFVAAFWATDRAIAILLSRCVQRSEFRFSKLYSGRAAGVEVFALGNSRGVNGFYAPEVERITGLRTINFSYNGLSTELAELLFLDYLDRYGSPRVMVLEVTCLLANNGLLKSLRTYQDRSDRLGGAVRDRLPRLYWAGELAHCFRYNNELFLRTMYYMHRNDQDWINRQVIDPAFATGYHLEPGLDPFSLASRQEEQNLAALERIVAVCKEKHIDLRLLVSPYMPAYIKQCRSFDHFISVVKARTGLPVWDYSNRLRNLGFFADPIHVNAAGCGEYIAMLAHDGFFRFGLRLSADEISTSERDGKGNLERKL